VDDLFEISPLVKLSLQLFASLLFCISLPLGLSAISFFTVPLILLWLILITNGINLIDNIDGLAGGISFISSISLFALGIHFELPIIIICTATLAGSTLG